MKAFSHYDRDRIGRLCEAAGLYSRAAEHFQSTQDIKRVLLNTHAIPKDQLVGVFAKLDPQDGLASLYDLMKSNRQNVQIVAEIAIANHDRIPPAKIIEMFEGFGAFDGEYYYLGHILPHTEDKDIYFKYIVAAAKLNKSDEIEQIIRQSTHYDPEKVRDFLMEAKLQNPKPLIYVCDQHGFQEELIKYLYKLKLLAYIEIYVTKVNQDASPKVLGALIDLDCDESFVKKLLYNVRMCPIDELVAEFTRRHKLKYLQGWLEQRANEGNTTPALHNALAIIYIDLNKDPQTFLINNQYYDSKVVGKYCEERNADLAYIAYKRAWGQCDIELVEVTNKNYLYRLQARYLVERQSDELWQYVLTKDNEHT